MLPSRHPEAILVISNVLKTLQVSFTFSRVITAIATETSSLLFYWLLVMTQAYVEPSWLCHSLCMSGLAACRSYSAYLKQTSSPYKPVTVRLTASIRQKVAVCAANAFNLSCLHSRSVSHRRYSLIVIVHSRSHSLAEVYIAVDSQSSWNIWLRSFKVYSKWLVQASKHTHVRNEVTLVRGSLRLAPIKHVEDTTGIIHLFWSYHCHSNRNILSTIALTLSDDISLC